MLEWGSHFCHLYRSREDVLETLVPFFAAGLENNEQCLWVTSDPVGTEDATLALAQRVSGLQSKIDRGQVRSVDQSDWYSRIGNRNADSVLNAWLDAEQSARAQGYSGLRLTGNVSFLKTSGQWREFERYEARVSDAFAGRRLIGACGYNLESTRVADVLDLVRDHQFTLVRREDKWEVLENVATKPARSELSRVNAELEQRCGKGPRNWSWRYRSETSPLEPRTSFWPLWHTSCAIPWHPWRTPCRSCDCVEWTLVNTAFWFGRSRT
jgi:hypothetical protein